VSWISRLLGSRRSEAAATAGPLDDAPPHPSAPPNPTARPHPTLPPLLPDALDAPPEAWATAMGVSPDALDGAAPALSPVEEATAQAILGHFAAHRPGPASFPSIALKLLDLVRDPKVDAAALARTIEMDPALSTGVLVLANSALFRGASQIETVRQAVARLGLGEVASLAAALSTRSLFRAEVRAAFELYGPAWNRLFYHATVVARSSAELARLRRLGDPDRVFLGGLLHDVGKSIALRSLAALVLDGRVPRHEDQAVDRILHHVHGLVGADAHREWGLPDGLAAIAECHHLPEFEIEPFPQRMELHLVRLVSALELVRAAPAVSPAAPAEVVGSARALGLGPERVRGLRETLAVTSEWVKMVFGEESGGPAAAR
jgi:putative nucleotidyltransferase with HDIG domain